MTKKKWIIGGVVAAVVILAMLKDASQKTVVRTAVVEIGNIAAFVEERAYTSLPRIYHITMPLQGRILPIELEEGDSVTNGQLVARIEDVDWHDATTQVNEMVFAMKSAVTAARAQIKANEARTEFTKWVYEANEKAKGDAISEQDKQRSRWQYLDSKVKTEESTATFYAMQAFYTITEMLRPYVQRNLERTKVISPVTGTVLKRHVWNEKVMTPGAQLLDIGNLEELEVTAEVLTEEAIRVKPGDRVEIFGESLGNRKLSGTVRRVEPEAFTKLSSLGVEQQRVRVNISFNSEQFAAFKDKGYTVGLHYRARVRIITAEKEQVLLVPRTALFRGDNGEWQAYKVMSGRVELVTVKVGVTNTYMAEVLEGLSEGDRLVDAPEASVVEGLRVEW